MDLFAEITRKLIHLSSMSIPIGYYFLPKGVAIVILLPIALATLAIDVLRLVHPPCFRSLYKRYGFLLREHESGTFTGATYMLSASLLSILCFEKDIAVAAISFLILGDMVAALIGKSYGRVRILDKTLEGSLVCFFTCILIAMVIPQMGLGIGLLGALVATVVELLPIPVDDNLLIPLLSGLAMQMVS